MFNFSLDIALQLEERRWMLGLTHLEVINLDFKE